MVGLSVNDTVNEPVNESVNKSFKDFVNPSSGSSAGGWLSVVRRCWLEELVSGWMKECLWVSSLGRTG